MHSGRIALLPITRETLTPRLIQVIAMQETAFLPRADEF
jgi:hypothetical protein